MLCPRYGRQWKPGPRWHRKKLRQKAAHKLCYAQSDGIPAEERDCVMTGGRGAVVIGSGVSGGVRNGYAYDSPIRDLSAAVWKA